MRNCDFSSLKCTSAPRETGAGKRNATSASVNASAARSGEKIHA